MQFERGPSEPSEMPLAPRVITPGLFQGMGADIVQILTGADTPLGQAHSTLAELLGDSGLDAQFTSDVGPALAALDALPSVDNDTTLQDVVGAVDGVLADIQAQGTDLPGPDDDDPQPPPLNLGDPDPGKD